MKVFELDTKGFNKKQMELFYFLENTKFGRNKYKDEMDKMYPHLKPIHVRVQMTKFTMKMKKIVEEIHKAADRSK